MSGLPQGAGVIRIAHEQPNALACLHRAIEVYRIPERHDLVESILLLFLPSLPQAESIKYTASLYAVRPKSDLRLRGVPG